MSVDNFVAGRDAFVIGDAVPGFGLEYAVADLKLAEFGRHEIRLAEHEMPLCCPWESWFQR